MSIFSSWNKALVGKPWIQLDDAGAILAGGSPRSGAPRSIHFQADQNHWLSRHGCHRAWRYFHDGPRRYAVCTSGRLTALVRSKWYAVEGTPPPGEGDAPPDGADHRPAVPVPDQEDSEGEPDTLDPREQTTLLVLVAAAARAGKLDAAAIERATDEPGVTLSSRTINKHLARIDDAIERRRDISR